MINQKIQKSRPQIKKSLRCTLESSFASQSSFTYKNNHAHIWTFFCFYFCSVLKMAFTVSFVCSKIGLQNSIWFVLNQAKLSLYPAWEKFSLFSSNFNIFWGFQYLRRDLWLCFFLVAHSFSCCFVCLIYTLSQYLYYRFLWFLVISFHFFWFLLCACFLDHILPWYFLF